MAFGGLFAALFVIVGVADGIGHPSVPSGAVAVVEDAPGRHDHQAGLRRCADPGRRPAGAAEGAVSVQPAVRDAAGRGDVVGPALALDRGRGRGARDHDLRHRDHKPAEADRPAAVRRPEAVPAVPEAGRLQPRAGAGRGRAFADHQPDREGGGPAAAVRLRIRDQQLLRGQQVAVLPARDARRARDRQQRSGQGRAGQGRCWSRTTRRRTGTRSPPSTRPTRPPRTAAAFVGESPRARARPPWTSSSSPQPRER